MLSLKQAQNLYTNNQSKNTFFVDLVPGMCVGFLDTFKNKKIKQLMIFLGRVKSSEYNGYEYTGRFYDYANDRIHVDNNTKYDCFMVFEEPK